MKKRNYRRDGLVMRIGVEEESRERWEILGISRLLAKDVRRGLRQAQMARTGNGAEE